MVYRGSPRSDSVSMRRKVKKTNREHAATDSSQKGNFFMLPLYLVNVRNSSGNLRNSLITP